MPRNLNDHNKPVNNKINYSKINFDVSESVIARDMVRHIDDAAIITSLSWMSSQKKRLVLGTLMAMRDQVESGNRAECVITNKSFAEFMGTDSMNSTWVSLLRAVFEVHRDTDLERPANRNTFELSKKSIKRDPRRTYVFNRARFGAAFGVSMLRDRNITTWRA